MGLFDALLTLRDEGRNIAKLLVTVEMLAQVRPLLPCVCVRYTQMLYVMFWPWRR